MPAPDAAAAVLARCRELGFALAGIAPAAPSAWADSLRRWLEAEQHGEMAYLARTIAERLDPVRFVPGARSIICVADRHHGGGADPAPPAGAPPRGRVARYARGEDYHRVMKRRLHRLCDELAHAHPGERFRACVDTAPVLEREHAQRAGLGAVGKHTLLIEPGTGSYLLLGEIVTTLALQPSRPADPDPCGSCVRCIDACPTDAISPWSVNATRCIGYLTIEHRSTIDERFFAAIGDWIFGCDICQEVCPHNQPTRRAAARPVHDAYASRGDALDLLEVLGWTEADRRAAFSGSALKRAKLSMMKRNALIAAGNALAEREIPALRSRIAAIASDSGEDEMVRATARVVGERDRGTGAPGG